MTTTHTHEADGWAQLHRLADEIAERARRADVELCRYRYWIDKAHEYAQRPDGYASEVYRCASQMAHRHLGRYDVLAEMAHR